jgi:hypothetical protein
VSKLKLQLKMLRIRPLLLLLLFTALPAWGQEEPATAQETTDRLLIEKITVEGPKAAVANIVRAETLLRAGGSYTEDQLRQAIYRVHRLPFVLDASFSLRRGSRRGAYELVVEVQPARWFFYDQWIRAYRFGEPLHLESRGFTSRDQRSSASVGGLAGARLFVGRSGVLFGALDSEEGVQIGFTQYDLLHRGILATAGFSTNACCVSEPLPLGLDPRFVSWDFTNSRRLSLNLAVPLGGRQSLQVAVSDRAGGAGVRQEILDDPASFGLEERGSVNQGELSYRRAEAKWVYDTSDDPVVPSRGSTLTAGLEASRFAAHGLVIEQRQAPFIAEPAPSFKSQQVLAAVSAVRYWSITPRQTVSGVGRIAAGRSQVENLLAGDHIVASAGFNTLGGSVRLQHSLTLQRSRGRSRLLDLRWETGAELGMERSSPAFGHGTLRRLLLETSLVYRNQWGRIRASLTFLSLGKVLP